MNWMQKKVQAYHAEHLLRTTQKMTLWASQIDTKHFHTTTKEQLMDFCSECTRLGIKMELLVQYEQKLENNSIYAMFEALRERHILSEAASSMIEDHSGVHAETIFHESEGMIEHVEKKIDEVKMSLKPDDYKREEITEFYINLALQHSVWTTLFNCHTAMKGIDFERLQESRF